MDKWGAAEKPRTTGTEELTLRLYLETPLFKGAGGGQLRGEQLQ
jgi:hypothetical protein